MDDKILTLLTDKISKTIDPEAYQWISGQVEAFSGAPIDRIAFVNAFAAVTRKLGQKALFISTGEAELFDKLLAGYVPADWTVDDFGRIVLMLVALKNLSADEHVELVSDLFYKGDNREKKAVLRSLCLLPEPDRFTILAIDSCRSHVQTVFEATACENPFTALFFPEHNFNQMVLKALFTGVKLDRIVNWKTRNNADLIRMASEYKKEREAAGREVPEDILTIIDNPRSES